MRHIALGIALLACVSIAFAQTGKTTRKPSPTLASLPAPKAGGAPHILLVVDDWDRSKGAPIYRKLIADAVGGDAKAWSSVVVAANQHGPALEKLRDFNVIVWYTGDSYGGGYNGISTLSDEDEKTVRRYLRETGGAFILLSPGFFSTRSYNTNWTESDNPFLREVAGINGFADLVQRFTAGTVRTPGGASFTVPARGTVETQFTAVNPNGAAVVFSATLDPKKTAEGPVPVAIANAYGGGRFVYVGFSLENMAEADRAKAFGVVLDAATGSRTAVAAVPTTPGRTVAGSGSDSMPSPKPPAAAPAGPPPTHLTVRSRNPIEHEISWQGIPEAATMTLFRKEGDRFVQVPNTGTLHGAISSPKEARLTRWSFYDEAFVKPGTVYELVARYMDGREGRAQITLANPVQPDVVTDLRVEQLGYRRISVTWKRPSNASSSDLRVFAPGIIATGQRTVARSGPDQWIVFREVPEGTHVIRLTYLYDGRQAPVSAQVTTTVVDMTKTSNDISSSAGNWVAEGGAPSHGPTGFTPGNTGVLKGTGGKGGGGKGGDAKFGRDGR